MEIAGRSNKDGISKVHWDVPSGVGVGKTNEENWVAGYGRRGLICRLGGRGEIKRGERRKQGVERIGAEAEKEVARPQREACGVSQLR